MHDPRAAASATLHFTSLLVQVTPRGRTALLNGPQLSGVQLHQTAAPSKLVVMLQAADERTTARVAEALLAITGVLTVSIITHLTESAAALEQELDT